MIRILIIGLLILVVLGCKKEEPNTPPVASFIITPKGGDTDTEFTFDTSGCSDVETLTDELKVRWDWENDGKWDTWFSMGEVRNHRFRKQGIYTICLQVKDAQGATTEVRRSLEVVEEFGKEPDGYFVDQRDGMHYGYISIGNQVWMAENLAYLPALSKADQSPSDEPYYCVYNFYGIEVSEAKETENFIDYGVLYNWIAASKSCPDGWHLPGNDEWEQLITFLGGTYDVGRALKSTTGWRGLGEGDKTNNTSGFNGKSGGYMWGHFTSFEAKGAYGIFWTSTIDGIGAWQYTLSWTSPKILRESWNRYNGFSVRCIKDEVRPEHQQ